MPRYFFHVNDGRDILDEEGRVILLAPSSEVPLGGRMF